MFHGRSSELVSSVPCTLANLWGSSPKPTSFQASDTSDISVNPGLCESL